MRNPLRRWPGRRWVLAGSPVLRTHSRHLRWASGIVSKFTGRSAWPGLRSKGMILSLPRGTQILRVRTLLHHFHSETRSPYLLERRQNVAQFTGGPSPSDGNHPFAIAPPAIVERSLPMLPLVRENLPRSGPAASRRNAIPSISSAELAKKNVLRRITGPAHTFIALKALPANMEKERAMPLDRQSGDPDSAAALSPRVLRKYRRIESRPFVASHGKALEIVAATAEEQPATIHRELRRNRVRQIDFQTEAPLRPQAVPQPPVINVTQIADAVLQQLDRRFIAARERMGRI
jgi:hypothetical protein